jgi:hypothetical protein
MLSQLPTELHPQLWSLQESTSILFASHTRLQSLLSSRLERLVPMPGTYTLSESAFFNYTNQLSAERSYLLEDAFPDWRYKIRLLLRSLSPYAERHIKFRGETITIQEWIDRLCSITETWQDGAREVDLPDFDEMVQEMQSSQVSTPTPLNSPRMKAGDVVSHDGTSVVRGLAALDNDAREVRVVS